MSTFSKTILLLTLSNGFMLTAWYLHLKQFPTKPLWFVILASWGIAFVEYMFHIPANRIGFQVLTLSQLQILQVGMSLLVFIPFAIFVMDRAPKLDYLWAALCLVAAAFFIFRDVPG